MGNPKFFLCFLLMCENFSAQNTFTYQVLTLQLVVLEKSGWGIRIDRQDASLRLRFFPFGSETLKLHAKEPLAVCFLNVLNLNLNQIMTLLASVSPDNRNSLIEQHAIPQQFNTRARNNSSGTRNNVPRMSSAWHSDIDAAVDLYINIMFKGCTSSLLTIVCGRHYIRVSNIISLISLYQFELEFWVFNMQFSMC